MLKVRHKRGTSSAKREESLQSSEESQNLNVSEDETRKERSQEEGEGGHRRRKSLLSMMDLPPFFNRSSSVSFSSHAKEMKGERREEEGEEGEEEKESEKEKVMVKEEREQPRFVRVSSIALMDALDKAEPYSIRIGKWLDLLYSLFLHFISFAILVHEFVKKHGIDRHFPTFFGIFCLFFGGHFYLLIIAIESTRLFVLDQTKDALSVLWEQSLIVQEESKKNPPKLQDSGDTSNSMVVFRKAMIFMKAVDPKVVMGALATLNASALAVLACLRVKIAHDLALGMAIGEVMEEAAVLFLSPILKLVVNEAYHKWIDPSVRGFARFWGCALALFISRIISLFHSALRGAQLVSIGIVRFFKGPKAKRSIKTSLNFLLLQCILTFFGIYTQVKSGLTLPFWIKLILGPALILEFFLTFFISLTSPSYAGHPDVGSGFHHHELEPEM